MRNQTATRAVLNHALAAPTPPRKHANTRTRYGACTHKCAGGGACVCDSRPHFYHTCKDENGDCPCHAVLRGAVSYEDRPRRQRVALALTQGNMLDLLALVRHIGGKRVRPGVGRAPYTPPGRKTTG